MVFRVVLLPVEAKGMVLRNWCNIKCWTCYSKGLFETLP